MRTYRDCLERYGTITHEGTKYIRLTCPKLLDGGYEEYCVSLEIYHEEILDWPVIYYNSGCAYYDGFRLPPNAKALMSPDRVIADDPWDVDSIACQEMDDAANGQKIYRIRDIKDGEEVEAAVETYLAACTRYGFDADVRDFISRFFPNIPREQIRHFVREHSGHKAARAINALPGELHGGIKR